MIDTCVTGASGFIGKRLMEKLGNTVKIIPHYEIHSSTYQDYDRLFFLSTYGNMSHHTDHRTMVKSNVSDLIFVLDNLFWGWLCYVSSSSVTLPVQTSYSRTKRAAEEILQALPELKSCIVRPYSCTGVGEQKEHLIPTLIRSCIEGEEMPFDPNPVHDFIDVEDVVDGLIRLADEQATGIHEFGNGRGYTNEAVKDIVEEVCGKKVNYTSVTPMRDYDDVNWYCKNPSPYFKSSKTLYESISEMVEAYERTQKL